MRIAVVIAAYNEAERIGTVLDRMPKHLMGYEVQSIVVDDGSHDKTSSVARSFEGVKVLRHRTNLGKGAAAKTGCDAACKMGADYIVLMDGDGQHQPQDIERLVKAVMKPTAMDNDKLVLAIGTRRRSKDMPFMMRFGNGAMNALARFFFGINVQDTQCGFRAFSRQAYPKIRWGASNYAMEMEMLILGSVHDLVFKEVKIDTIYLDSYKGTTVLDGLRILRVLLKWKLLWLREYNSLEPYSL